MRKNRKMAKDKHQLWIVKNPQGIMLYWTLSSWRRISIRRRCADAFDWKSLYKKGSRCMKVWLYREPRIDPKADKEQLMEAIRIADGVGIRYKIQPAAQSKLGTKPPNESEL